MAHSTRELRVGKILVMAIMLTGLWGTVADRAEALSMGPYLDISSGSGSYEWDTSIVEFDVDTSSTAIGFALDTSTDYSYFNYRLNIGFEGQELEDEFNDTLDLNGITFENVFGFAFVQQPGIRWWGGPLIRFGFYSGDTNTRYDALGPYRIEYDFFQFGFGVATGVNFKVSNTVVLAPSAGIRFIGAAGTGTEIDLITNTQYEEDITGNSTNIFLNFAVLF